MRQFKEVNEELIKNECYKGEEKEPVMLPLRGTKTSAGYDFFTPVELVIKPQDKVFFWTDVCAEMEEDEVLLLDVRSSIGTKRDLMLANTIPVIDSDYIQADNGGNIGIMLRNLKPSMKLEGYIHILAPTCVIGVDGVGHEELLEDENGELVMSDSVVVPIPNIVDLTAENTVVIPKGERVAQGIIVNFKESVNCNSEEQRTGGFGSTNK